mgnify:CR=1 FL=1|tara:strand:+ start:1543 stop:2166 length:624 start_codon:yes stop_codon:yes gene_type:complete
MAKQKFWSDAAIEPKRKYRFLLSFNGIPQWIIKTTGKPNFTVTESEHAFINYKFYYPGRLEWAEITVSLVDPVDPDASHTMLQLIENSGYVAPHNFLNDPQSRGKASNVVTFSKKRAVDAVGGRMYIHMIDEDGSPVETWTLYNPWIKGVNFGDLDYTSDDLVNVEVTMRYDWADLETKVVPERDLVRAGGFASSPVTNRENRAPGV